MPRNSRLGKVFGSDPAFVARFVDIWRVPRNVGGGPIEEGTPRTPISLNDIAWELGVGQSKVAITMKYAEQEGWVRRVSPRTEQATWEPTEKGLEQFPEGGVQVMPPPAEVELAGGKVTAVSAREAEQWRDDVPERAIPKGQPFRGYLPEGSDDAA